MTLPLPVQEAYLEEKIAKLNAQLKEVRKRIAHDRRRKLNRLKVMVGQLVLEDIYRSDENRKHVYLHLARVLTRPHDRAVFLARYPRKPGETISTPEQQRRRSKANAKLDWQLTLLIGAAMLKRAKVNQKFRTYLRAQLTRMFNAKRDRAIIESMFDAATKSKNRIRSVPKVIRTNSIC